MAWNPIIVGNSVVVVAVTGTPVQIISTHKSAQSVLIQVLPNNTGRIVVGYDNTVRANAAGTNPSGSVLAILGAPSTNTATPPSANGSNPTAPAALNLQQFWLDASVGGEGVIVSYLV